MNLPTIIILSLVVIAFVLIIYREVKNKKNGKCSCGCSDCALKGSCGKKD